MYGFEIKRTLKKTDVPDAPRGVRRDYSKLIKSVATLLPEEALELSVDKKHVVEGIRQCIKKHFKHSKFSVTSRTKENGSISVYITRED